MTLLKNPSHPGEVLAEPYLEPREMNGQLRSGTPPPAG